MQIDLTAIIGAIIAAISSVLVGVLVPYINGKTSLAQRQTAMELIRAAVAAAEQIFWEPGTGQRKKAYVLEWLAARGLKIDPDELDAQIEAAVYALKHGLGE